MAGHSFPIDFTTLNPGSKPNTFLVLPAGFESTAAADAASPVWTGAEPTALLDAFKAAGLSQARTTLVQQGEGQVELVQRSAIFRFPDFITAQAVAVDGGAALCVLSRSKVGYSDLGVNAKRVRAWLALLPNPL